MDQISEFASAQVFSPPEAFNFAEHLFSLNAGRGAKAAFVDNTGSLSYGELEARSRRLATGLRALNAVAAVTDCAPGWVTPLDLPLIPGVGTIR